MSVEMLCGSCQGRFLVSAAGTVACPHCGSHVLVSADVFREAQEPDAAAAGSSSGAAVAEEAAPQTATQPETEPAAAQPAAPESSQPIVENAESPSTAAAETASPDVASPETGSPEIAASEPQPPEAGMDVPPLFADETAAGDDPSGDAKTITIAEFNRTQGVPGDGLPDDDPMTEMFTAPEPVLGGDEYADEFPDFADPAGESAAADIDALLENADTRASVPDDRPASSQQPLPPAVGPIRTTAGRRGQVGPVRSGVPVTWFVILASYASAITIVCLYLLFANNYSSSQLENLEDPAEAPDRGKNKSVTLYQADLRMPPSHQLRLGESRRFGNIVVEPLKVTLGPLEFVHFSGEERESRPPSEPVVKLWLRFRNASKDQTIAPLDSVLLFTNRVRDKRDYEKFHANIFLCREEEKKPDGHLLHVYDLNVNDRWDLKEQHLGQPLQPGESLLTYIPTGEKGLARLTGELVWRVHFRKGYAPSGRGVTTLLEVKFHSKSIRAEAEEEETVSL